MKMYVYLFAIYYRYLELIFPIWHKTHFKMKYLYSPMAMCWIFGIGYNLAYVIPTSKVLYVRHSYSSLSFQIITPVVQYKFTPCCLMTIHENLRKRFSISFLLSQSANGRRQNLFKNSV